MEWMIMIDAEKESSDEKNRILACNQKGEQFGLTLTEKQCQQLIMVHQNTLKEYARIETGKGILESLVSEFQDSSFISQNEYPEILSDLQEVFCWFKNETEDMVSDSDCLQIMKDFFEHEAGGSVTLLYDSLYSWMDQCR